MNDVTSPGVLALVAEDEPLQRTEIADLLGAEGFDVIEASTAASALAQIEQQGGIALLFTDIHMPGPLDGLALAHEVDQRWPHTHIIICADIDDIDLAALPEKAVFLGKPYHPVQVVAAVRHNTNVG